MSQNDSNPIDKDKTSDSPGLLEYAHHVGSALIRPEDKGKLKLLPQTLKKKKLKAWRTMRLN